VLRVWIQFTRGWARGWHDLAEPVVTACWQIVRSEGGPRKAAEYVEQDLIALLTYLESTKEIIT
jgi:hypothetical protein